jgi:hypothetical protein
MNQPLEVARSAAWRVLTIAVAVCAGMVFLDDLFPHHSLSWDVATSTVAAAAGAIIAFPRANRALLELACLTALSFLIIYDVLDVLVDPIMVADWPIIIIAMLLASWLVGVFGILVFADE